LLREKTTETTALDVELSGELRGVDIPE